MIVHNTDGSHCKGLIMNVFHTLWPSLAKQPGFITSLLTPIIKVTRGEQQLSFYSGPEFEKWQCGNDGGKGWRIKYYKGLGTSTDDEAKEYFQNMHLVKYDFKDAQCDDSLDLAFNKKRADDRKRWLGQYNPDDSFEVTETEATMSYTDFINRDLIHFSVYDVKRSIPSVVDGLKPSQRKILFSCFKRNLTSEIKVAQLAGYVSENAAYHHGEASLQGAIIGMAQDFVGSNNMNLLRPNGMFGSRRLGGKDAASPRYIYTQLDTIASKVFRKEDMGLLTYLQDDGLSIEPEYYVPVLPMVLINGACGIGTGFSTNIPCYDPIDVINALRGIISGEMSESFIDGTVSLPADETTPSNSVRAPKNMAASPSSTHEITHDSGETSNAGETSVMKPWYRGFKGSISPKGGSFVSRGRFVNLSDTVVEITELPIGMWSEDYKVFLGEYLDSHPKVLKDYETHYTNNIVRFVLHFYPGELQKIADFDKEFKITGSCLATTNMHLFDERGVIKKYTSIDEIIRDFYEVRRKFYDKRKSTVLGKIEKDIAIITAKAKFIGLVCDGTIVVSAAKKDVEDRLCGLGFVKMDGTFGYLLNMPIYSLTSERRAELLKEIGDLEAEMKRYSSIPIKDIWLGELTSIAEEYRKSLEVYDKKLATDAIAKPAKAAKKQRRA